MSMSDVSKQLLISRIITIDYHEPKFFKDINFLSQKIPSYFHTAKQTLNSTAANQLKIHGIYIIM